MHVMENLSVAFFIHAGSLISNSCEEPGDTTFVFLIHREIDMTGV